MPNWCSNMLNFEGGVNALNSFYIDWNESLKTHEGFNPLVHKGFKTHEDCTGYFFDADELGKFDTSFDVSVQTKWGPLEVELQDICKRYDLTCRCEYEESGMGLYGVLYVYLDRHEYKEFPYNEVIFSDNDDDFSVKFRDKEYHSIFECVSCWIEDEGL